MSQFLEVILKQDKELEGFSHGVSYYVIKNQYVNIVHLHLTKDYKHWICNMELDEYNKYFTQLEVDADKLVSKSDNYFVYQDTKGVYCCERDSAYAIMRDAAEMYCFEDIWELEVLSVVADGELVIYQGWKPNMKFVFINAETREVVFEEQFPQWEH